MKTDCFFSRYVNFKAFLISDDNIYKFPLNCTNIVINNIECLSGNDIILDTNKKYYFNYNKRISKNNITFNGDDIFEDNKRVSLIFKPKIPDNLKLFNDKKAFHVEVDNNMVFSKYMYFARKSKKILKAQRNGFNKNIELNNFIPHCGLAGYRPQSTLIAYKEAIRRGYKIVDGDILFTKDKIPVICHGSNLGGISNGEGDLTEKTLKELENLDFGIKFNEKYKGEKILKFEDLLKLCKKNDIIIDLDLYHMDYNKYFKDTDEYAKIIIQYVQKYGMYNSIFFNEKRQSVIELFKSIKKDISFSINGMNERESIEKIKDKYQDSKILIYNMGSLAAGKTINEETVKYGLSLGKKIKAAKIDEIEFANKVLSWGVNFICTNKIPPFMINNDKEEPSKIKCYPLEYNGTIECKIDEKINLIDNEIYNIYTSNNTYNISENIIEEPIGEFTYINTNASNQLYYDIKYFDFKDGIIRIRTSNILKEKEQINGLLGPAFDNVAECYQI